MAVMAPVSGLSLAALAKFSAGLPLPEAAAAPDKQGRVPDVVVFSSAPMRVLSDLASAGLRQLAALLPILEQAVQEESAVPLGYLANAAGAAARQIGEGHPALIAEGPDRVAAALRGPTLPQNNSPANATTDTKQMLRTLARQISADAEPAQDGLTSEAPDRLAAALSKSPAGAPPDPKQVLRAVAHQLESEGPQEDRAGESSDQFAATLPKTAPSPISSSASVLADAKQVLRTIARQVGAEAEPARDGKTSEILRSIARQIGTADDPEPLSRTGSDAGPIQRWLTEAKHVLRSTGDVLDQAEQQLRPLAAAEPLNQAAELPAGWALSQIVAAQAQIAMAYASLGQARTAPRLTSRTTPASFRIDHLAGATTFLGMLLVLATLWLIGGIWSVATGAVALGGAAVWVWRISQASRGVALDARR